MKTYTLTITGSGTASQIGSRLYELAADLVNGGEPEREAEDSMLSVSIADEETTLIY